MLKNYLLVIEELRNENVVSEDPTTFNMNTVADYAKSGNTALLEQLYDATKVKVYERHISYGKDTLGQEVIKEYSICTPKEGRNVTKENIATILPSNSELVAHLVGYHNENCDQTGMEEVSLDELNSIHQATQGENVK